MPDSTHEVECHVWKRVTVCTQVWVPWKTLHKADTLVIHVPLLADAPHCSIVLLFQRWRSADVLVGLTWWIQLLLFVV